MGIDIFKMIMVNQTLFIDGIVMDTMVDNRNSGGIHSADFKLLKVCLYRMPLNSIVKYWSLLNFK